MTFQEDSVKRSIAKENPMDKFNAYLSAHRFVYLKRIRRVQYEEKHDLMIGFVCGTFVRFYYTYNIEIPCGYLSCIQCYVYCNT